MIRVEVRLCSNYFTLCVEGPGASNNVSLGKNLETQALGISLGSGTVFAVHITEPSLLQVKWGPYYLSTLKAAEMPKPQYR